MEQILILFSTALVSGLFATIVTLFYQSKKTSYLNKLSIFTTLMSHRYFIALEENVNALNTIDVIFYKDKNVRDAYKEFLEEANKNQGQNPQIDEKYLKLLEAIACSLRFNDIHWDEIKHYYYPVGLADKQTEEAMLRKLQIQNVSSSINKTGQKNNNQVPETIMMQVLPDLLSHPEKIETLMRLAEKTKGN